MKHDVSQVDGGNCARSFKETMLTVIEHRLQMFFKFTESNMEVIVAAVSIPRFKTDFIQYEHDVARAHRMLLVECAKLSQLSTDQFAESSNTADNDDMFVSYASNRTVRRSSIELSVEAEVERYLNDERKEITMLNDYPNVRNVYFKFNTTLASSGAVRFSPHVEIEFQNSTLNTHCF